MKSIKKKFGFLIIFFLISASIFQVLNFNNLENSTEAIDKGNIQNSSLVTNTRQWIINGDFSSADNWTSTKGELGDPEDVSAIIDGGSANFTVNGESQIYSIAGVPNSTWTAFNNSDWGVGMDEGTERGISDEYGCWANYTWDEQIDQTGSTPSVHWKKNITLPVDMSDYKITSAFLNVTFNATVTVLANDGGIDVIDDSPQIQLGDYARFYVLISDIENVYQPFQIANNRTKYLGWDTGSVSTIITTSLKNIDEALMINYLEFILGINSTTFTITLGIDIYCEDNTGGYDVDIWDKLRINFLNLSFSYERKINPPTTVSWNQEGDKPIDIITNPFVIDDAILNFKYKTNDSWPIVLSPNSEIQVLINDIPHSETIKLWSAKTTFQNASLDGFDVKRLIEKDNDINVSIQVYLADEFELNRTIYFSIDDVYLNITYTETVPDISTDFQLFLDGEDKTIERVTQLPLAENLNISLRYTNQTGDHIPGATIHLEGKVNNTLDEYLTLERYSTIVNTTKLGIGVWILTIIAQKTLYETQEIPFFVDVTERDAEMQLILMGEPKNDGDTIGIEADEVINVTVSFRDNVTGNHLPNATITLLGWDQLNETNNQYNININASYLDKGINAFTIFAQLINYKTQSINFFIEVFEKATEYKLFINGIDLKLNPLFNLTVFENLNITVKYTDNQSQHITNATLQLIGEGLSLDVPENITLQHYSRIIDTTILGIGVKVFNIIAQKSLYETQNIQFFVEIIERDAKMQLFLNMVPQNDSDTITVEIDDTINITVYFRDKLLNDHLPNATITLLGWDFLNETNEQYNITINANDLEQGITAFTIFAQLVNYQTQSIQFFIKVVERSTDIQLFINGEDKTIDRVFNLTIGQNLNITVKYVDNQTGYHILGALVQLVGEGLPISLTRDDILGQHFIILDTTDLGIGVKLFSIVAQANNYEIQTIDPRITVNRISTLISLESGESQIEAELGEAVLIKTILNNTVFGGLILNATVTFRWAYGQGELVDLDNNGIYEVTLENVPVGIYQITITAYAGDDYDFETKNIALIVTRSDTGRGIDLSWLIYVLIGAIVGLSTVFTLYQTHFKYPPMVRKVRKLRKKIKKGKKSKPIIALKRKEIVDKSYKDQSNIIESESKLDSTQIKNIIK